MNTNQLECFVSLANSLNYTQVAESMYISQPALSRIIVSLEKELGVTLFNRNKRSVTLTPAGEAFLEDAQKILLCCHEGVSRAQQAESGVIGRIKIGFLRDSSNPFIPALVNEFKKRYPKINLSLLEFSHSGLVRAFNNEDIDFQVALRREPYDPPGTSSLTWSTSWECAVLPLSHPLANRMSLDLIELRDEPFVVMDRSVSSPGYDFVMNLCLNRGFVPKIVSQAAFIPSLIMQVACGVGVTVLTSNFRADTVKLVRLCNVDVSQQVISWHTRAQESPCIQNLISVAEDMVNSRSFSSSFDVI